MLEFDWSRFSIIAQEHTDKIWILSRDAVQEVANEANLHVAYVDTYVDENEKPLLHILKEAAKVSRSTYLFINKLL